MKRLFPLFVLFVLFSNSSYAQANLQLNEVVSIDTTVSSGVAHTIYTVPAGKVLKIEFASIYASSSGVNLMGVRINNVAIFSRNGGTGATGRPGNDPLRIVWVKAGDQVQLFSSGAGYTVSGFVSALEFNLVP